LLTGVIRQVRAKVASSLKCLILKYKKQKLFSVYRESIVLKWRFFFPIDKRHLSVLFFKFADVSCMVYEACSKRDRTF